MPSRYNNLFLGVYNSVKGTPLSAWLLILSVILLLIGGNNFAEDTYSSYVGVQMMENALDLNPATWKLTYWAMSLFFQIIAVIAFFIYLSDRQNNWQWFWLAAGSQVIDFIADVWYRSDQRLFDSPVKFVVSLLLTFVFFTAGSELALTVGFGLVATMFKDGFTQFGHIISGIFAGFSGAGRAIAGGKTLPDSHEPDKQNKQQHFKNYRERNDIDPEALRRLEQFRNQRNEPKYAPMNMHPTNNGGGNKDRSSFQPKRKGRPPKKMQEPVLHKRRNEEEPEVLQ